MSVNCNFGAYLKTALRNQLVCGVRNKRIKDRLLESKELTYEKAVEIATSLEASQENGSQITESAIRSINTVDRSRYPPHPGSTSSTFYQSSRKINKPKYSGHSYEGNAARQPPTTSAVNSSIKCYRCVGPHLANVCKHINSLCRYCNRRGHLAITCLKKQRSDRAVNAI